MVDINVIHQHAQKLEDDVHTLRLSETISRHERGALLLLEAHAKAASELAFALGNARDPQG